MVHCASLYAYCRRIIISPAAWGFENGDHPKNCRKKNDNRFLDEEGDSGEDNQRAVQARYEGQAFEDERHTGATVGTEGTVRGVDDIGSVIQSNLQERWRQYSIEKFLSSLCGYKLASLKNMHPFHDSAKRTQGELGDLEELLPERDSYNGDTQNQTKQKIDQGQL